MIFGACPAPILDHKTIVLGHGSGGKLTHQLIQEMILPAFRNPLLETQHDGAVFSLGGTRVAFSTDSYVVNPIFFPGGNIGDLAVNGTVTIFRCVELVRSISRRLSLLRKGSRWTTSGGFCAP